MPLVAFREPVPQRDDRRMQPKLQDGGYPATGVMLDLRQAVDIAGIERQRLFADRVGAGAHRIPAMGIVQMVRRADRGIIDFLAAAAKLIDVAIEFLEPDEELRVGKMAVQNADGVVGVIGDNEISARFRDRAHVPGRNVTGGADDRGMQPKLQDGGYPATGVMLDLRQTVDIPGIEGERLFADGVGAGAHRITAMGVMKVVRRADRGIVNFLAAAAKLIDVAIERLEPDEELRVGKMAVQNADGVVRIIGGNKISAGFRDRTHVPGRNVTGSADKGIGCQRLSPICKNRRSAGPNGLAAVGFS